MSSFTAKTIDKSKTQSKPPDTSNPSKKPKPRTDPKREATLYDAVAGRISSTGFLPPTPVPSLHRDRPSSTTIPAPPEEVLFRRRAAPSRFAEHDTYFASDDLPPGALPDAELVKAVHAYAADFYARGPGEDCRSLDETALLAVGVLVEEVCRGVVGGSGDLALVEPEEGGGGGVGRSVVAASAGSKRSGDTRRGRKRKRVERGVGGERGGSV